MKRLIGLLPWQMALLPELELKRRLPRLTRPLIRLQRRRPRLAV